MIIIIYNVVLCIVITYKMCYLCIIQPYKYTELSGIFKNKSCSNLKNSITYSNAFLSKSDLPTTQNGLINCLTISRLKSN